MHKSSHCHFVGMIILDPPYGGMLGGSGVAVTGDNLFLSEDDNIMCSFDGIEVSGVYVSQEKALCISPMLERTGRLGFRLRVTGRNFFSGDSTFTSCKPAYSKGLMEYTISSSSIMLGSISLKQISSNLLLLFSASCIRYLNFLCVLAYNLPSDGLKF